MAARTGALAELLIDPNDPWPWEPWVCPVCWIRSKAAGEYRLSREKAPRFLQSCKGDGYGPDFLQAWLEKEGDLRQEEVRTFVKEVFSKKGERPR